MREYKFRGKREDGKGWVYGYYARCEDTHYIYQPEVVVLDAEINDTDNVLMDYPVIPETVGQFTGLYDKHGVEIYEGDRVKVEDSVIYELKWNDYTATYRIGAHIVGNTWMPRHLEIIGNIHQEVKE